MNRKRFDGVLLLSVCAVGVAVSSAAMASTLTQNLSWTVDRADTTTNYRLVAYGDSIYAGYYGSITNVIKRAATTVDAEYLSKVWNADIENVRRCKSGAVASDIYNNKIVAEHSYMQSTNTRIVTFEMCGNDGLQARSSFAGETGTCDYSVLDTALANCTTYQQLAMQYINANAYSGTKLKVIANLYYTGYDADNANSSCIDPTTGQPVNRQDKFLPYIARMNWRACNFANTYGFACADIFSKCLQKLDEGSVHLGRLLLLRPVPAVFDENGIAQIGHPMRHAFSQFRTEHDVQLGGDHQRRLCHLSIR